MTTKTLSIVKGAALCTLLLLMAIGNRFMPDEEVRTMRTIAHEGNTTLLEDGNGEIYSYDHYLESGRYYVTVEQHHTKALKDDTIVHVSSRLF